MNLPGTKKSTLEEKLQKRLRKETLANPQAHGLHGSLSDGINAQEMKRLAKEYEDKEAARRKEIMTNAPGSARLLSRPIPEVITSRWVWKARISELQDLLMKKGGKTLSDLQGVGILELRYMARPFITHSRARPGRKKPGPTPNLPEWPEKPPPAERKGPEIPRSIQTLESMEPSEKEADMVRVFKQDYPGLFDAVKAMIAQKMGGHKYKEVGLRVHCPACGFLAEYTAEGVRWLQKKEEGT